MSDERAQWERRPRESDRAYAAFRQFRDLGPLRSLDRLAALPEYAAVRRASLTHWSTHFGWIRRARAWDDHVYRLADSSRLDSLREMQSNHQRAGRAAMSKALAALQRLDAREIPPAVAVRLLEVGTKLERGALAASLAELQGVDVALQLDVEDPWELIAREFREPALGDTAPS